ncbi:single-stranded DNA-binding protein [Compostibacter hankyongensis]|uniref:Single-stranded DNA-binding protein n=1 Tax=Compostibacter hankyongensis TaxID=1007089 RepID=A0ABP8G3G2_9BACT
MNHVRNSVRLIGNLGMNPDIRELGNGKKMARFSLATNESRRDAEGNRVTETSWHHLVAWGKSAEIAERFLHKGSEVAIEGKLTHRQYVDREGVKRQFTEIVVNDFLMLGSRQ